MIKNGDKVEIMSSGVIGTVIGICIRGVENQTFEIEVSWCSSGSMHREWLWDYQLKLHKPTKRKAGLVNYEREDVIKQIQ